MRRADEERRERGIERECDPCVAGPDRHRVEGFEAGRKRRTELTHQRGGPRAELRHDAARHRKKLDENRRRDGDQGEPERAAGAVDALGERALRLF